MPNVNNYREQATKTSYKQRCAEYRKLTLAAPAQGPYTELIRIIEGQPASGALLLEAAQQVEERVDCADFLLHGLLAIMSRFPAPAETGKDPLDPEIRERLRSVVLGFKYWPDEPGSDQMCTWTESHQIMFASGAYLAGQLYPDEVFTNSGRTGRKHMNRFRPRIQRWLDLKFRTGFGEWLNGVAYNESLPALLNLAEFAYDPKLVRSAALVIDAMLLDVVLNQFRGTFGATRGRSYEHLAAPTDDEPQTVPEGTGARRDGMESVIRLVLGTNQYRVGNMGASLLSVSTRYDVPAVLAAIARDPERPEVENRQRMGIRLAEAEQWGLGFRSYEDGMVYMSMQAYLHERTAALTLRMFDAFGWWDKEYFAPIRKRRGMLRLARRFGFLRSLMRQWAPDLGRTTREEVNIYTQRTSDYMLSCAQDYRAGYGSDEQRIWQATLGPDAVVSMMHSGDWTGSGILPRAVQYRNVLICHSQGESRVWFPQAEFDEVREESGWIFARRGSGYAALWSQQPYQWREDDGDRMVVATTSTVWICVCGRHQMYGTFDEFVEVVTKAAVEVVGHGSREQAAIDIVPHGKVCLGKRGPLTVGGWEMPITSHVRGSPYPAVEGYRRYDNPYVAADFPANIVRIRCGDETLSLNWRDQSRTASSFL